MKAARAPPWRLCTHIVQSYGVRALIHEALDRSRIVLRSRQVQRCRTLHTISDVVDAACGTGRGGGSAGVGGSALRHECEGEEKLVRAG